MSALVSCLGGDTFYQSYVADITFEYDGPSAADYVKE